MKYDYVLFDSDNTLLDFTGSQDKSFKEMLQRYGVVFTDDIYRRYKEINHGYWRRLEEGTDGATSEAIITSLAQNAPVNVSVLVYLDGEEIENSDVAANIAQSMSGMMNLQFSSSAELVPMEYGELHTPAETTP